MSHIRTVTLWCKGRTGSRKGVAAWQSISGPGARVEILLYNYRKRMEA